MYINVININFSILKNPRLRSSASNRTVNSQTGMGMRRQTHTQTQTQTNTIDTKETGEKRKKAAKHGQMDTIIVITFCEISFTYCTCDDRKNLCDKHKKISASHKRFANRHKYNIKFVNLYRTRSKQSGR